MKDSPEVKMGDDPVQFRQNTYEQDSFYEFASEAAGALGQPRPPVLSEPDKCLGENYTSGQTPKLEKKED